MLLPHLAPRALLGSQEPSKSATDVDGPAPVEEQPPKVALDQQQYLPPTPGSRKTMATAAVPREPMVDKLGGPTAVSRGLGAVFTDLVTQIKALRAALGDKVDGSGELVVWAAENRTASDGAIVRVGLDTEIDAGRDGLHVRGVHVSGETVVDDPRGHEPFLPGREVTVDRFDQVQVLWTAHTLLKRLEAAGIDLEALQRDTVNDGVLRIAANAMSDMNAFYSPTANRIALGTSNDTWHLASDCDVVAHEIGHYILDHINPGMSLWGDSGAIHEGFGDAISACFFDDPEISEDFGMQRPIAPTGLEGVFLRNIDNDLKRSDVGREVHDLGRVYGGYMWSFKRKLQEVLGDDNKLAAKLAFDVVAKHGFHYTTTRVTAPVFVRAMLESARENLAADLTGPELDEILGFLRSEGVRREIIDSAASLIPPEPPPLLAALLNHLPETAAPRDVATALDATVAANSKARFQPISMVSAGELDKVICRADVVDPHNGKTLVIEDSYVAALMRDGTLVNVGGRTELPEAIDWTPLDGGIEGALERTKVVIREFCKERMQDNPALRDFVNNRQGVLDDTDDWQLEEVVARGRRALSVNTPLGQFVVTDDQVVKSRMLFVA